MKYTRVLPLRLLPMLFLVITSCSGLSHKAERGGRLPNIRVISLSGASSDLDSMVDNQAALIVFWATWCEPCRAEVPDINRLAEQYAPQKFRVIGVAMGEPINVVKAGAAQLGIQYPVVVAPDTAQLADVGIEKIPKLVLADNTGRVIMVETGLTDALRTGIKELNAQGSASARFDSHLARLNLFSRGFSSSGGPPSPMIWLLGIFLSIPFYYSLIVVHSCSHNTLTRSRRVNRWIGEILSFMNLFRFADFRALHTLHHARTNQLGQDPHCVRPGETRLHYLLTQYFQLVWFTYTEFYRRTMWPQYWKGVKMETSGIKRSDLLGKILIISGRQMYGAKGILVNNVVMLLLAVFALFWLSIGLTGVLYPIALWLLPWMISQILIANFNYRGHVGLLHKGASLSYQGEDTRNLDHGFGRIINLATFGFYRHQDHHRWPHRF